MKNVSIHEIGLSDKKHEATISYSSGFSAGAFVSKSLSRPIQDNVINEKIKLETLDGSYKRLGIAKCDFLKVDIEGHEASFLAGAKDFIAKFKPMTIMEANHWCLNVFSRTTLPGFIDLLYKNFPHVFAFNNGEYLDLNDSESRYSFYYQNAVNNKFRNLFCGFDKNQLLRNLNAAFDERVTELQETNDRLNERNAELLERCRRTEARKSHRMAIKVRPHS